MLIFSARSFFECGRALRTTKCDCVIGSAFAIGNDVMFQLAREIDDQGQERALTRLELVEKEFRKIGLAISADTVMD